MHYHEYETTYIAQPDLPETELSRLTEKFQGIIEARSGSVLVRDDMGRRKLAYPIGKHAYGVYVYLNYVGPADIVLEVERNLRNEDTIIRFLTVRNEVDVDPEERRGIALERQRKRLEQRAAQPDDEYLEHIDPSDAQEGDGEAGDED